MRGSEKDRRGLPPRGPTTIAVTAETQGFGLGIQVFKIDAQAIRLDKKEKRTLMQNVENPAFARKYEKPTAESCQKLTEESRVNRLKKISGVLPQANKTEKVSADGVEAAIFTKPNLSIGRRSGTSEKPPHPSSTTNVKPLVPSDLQRIRKVVPTPSSMSTGAKRPTHAEQKQAEIIVTFPALENEQLRRFEDLQKQTEQKRRQIRRKLKKLKQEAPPEEEQRLQHQLEMLDSRSVIEEIVEQQKLGGYNDSTDEQQCDLVAYMRGDLNKPPQDDFVEVRQVWAGFVNNVRGQKQLPEPEVTNPAKLGEE